MHLVIILPYRYETTVSPFYHRKRSFPMSLSHEQIDQTINEHFMYEATDDVEGVLASLAEDAEHHVVPSPFGIMHGRANVRPFYEMLFGDVKGESVTPVRRLYGD